MMISPAGASDPYAAAAALDRQLRSSGDDPDDSSSGGTTLESGPDVVVTLSKGSASPSPSTYDASGKMPGTPNLDDMGANGPHSMAKASESDHDDDASPSAASASGATSSTDDSTADATTDEDATVAA